MHVPTDCPLGHVSSAASVELGRELSHSDPPGAVDDASQVSPVPVIEGGQTPVMVSVVNCNAII
jgi:hypothetical protein